MRYPPLRYRKGIARYGGVSRTGPLSSHRLRLECRGALRSMHLFLVSKVSGVEKLTRSILKGLSNRALFAHKNGHFASRYLLLGIGYLKASKKANCLSKVPLRNPIKPDRVSFFCTPKINYRQTLLLGEINFQLQIQNRAARGINFHYRDRSVEMSAENLSLQIQILS